MGANRKINKVARALNKREKYIGKVLARCMLVVTTMRYKKVELNKQRK